MKERILNDAKEMTAFYAPHMRASGDTSIVKDFSRELMDLIEEAYKAGQWDKRDEELTKGLNGLK